MFNFLISNIIFLYIVFSGLNFQNRQRIFFIKPKSFFDDFPFVWVLFLLILIFFFFILNDKIIIFYLYGFVYTYIILIKISFLRLYYYFFKYSLFRYKILKFQIFFICKFINLNKNLIIIFSLIIIILFYKYLIFFFFLNICLRLIYNSLVISNDYLVIGLGQNPTKPIYLTFAGKRKIKEYKKSLFDSSKIFEKEKLVFFEDYFYVDDEINKLRK